MVSWVYGLLVLIWVGSWVIGPHMGVVGLLVLKKFLIYLLENVSNLKAFLNYPSSFINGIFSIRII